MLRTTGVESVMFRRKFPRTMPDQAFAGADAEGA